MVFRWGSRLTIFAVLLSLILFALLPALTVYASCAESGRVKLLLRFKPGVRRCAGEGLLRSLEVYVVDEMPQISVLVVSVPERAAERVKSALMRNPMVDFIEDDRLI